MTGLLIPALIVALPQVDRFERVGAINGWLVGSGKCIADGEVTTVAALCGSAKLLGQFFRSITCTWFPGVKGEIWFDRFAVLRCVEVVLCWDNSKLCFSVEVARKGKWVELNDLVVPGDRELEDSEDKTRDVEVVDSKDKFSVEWRDDDIISLVFSCSPHAEATVVLEDESLPEQT